jgi:hypothetical protein
MMKNTTKLEIGTLIENKNHSEWGTWQVTGNNGQWITVRNSRGEKVLQFDELQKFWIVK